MHGQQNIKTPSCFGRRVPSSGSLLEQRNTSTLHRPKRYTSHAPFGWQPLGITPIDTEVCIGIRTAYRI